MCTYDEAPTQKIQPVHEEPTAELTGPLPFCLEPVRRLYRVPEPRWVPAWREPDRPSARLPW